MSTGVNGHRNANIQLSHLDGYGFDVATFCSMAFAYPNNKGGDDDTN